MKRMSRGLRVSGLVALVVAGALLLVTPARSSGARAEVVRVDLDTAIQPLSASYVVDAIHRAEQAASAVLLRIDTPGGTDGSMRRITTAILASHVPVVCWVGPSGAHAASAGAFVLLSCNWATMAPGTVVGAAQPVGLRGEVLAAKPTADAAAYLRMLAQLRGKNKTWAERAVRDNATATASEALELGVINAVADSPQAALRSADGVSTNGGAIESWPADVRREPMPAGRALVGSLVDPNLAFLLLVLGLAGLAFEILHPGLTVPGVLGMLLVVLSLVVLQMLPVNLGGVVLVVAGIALFALEAHVPGVGLPALGGVASLALGGMLLFDAHTLVRVSRALVVVVVVVMGLGAVTVLRSLRAARLRPIFGRTLVGAEGVTLSELDPVGTVRVRSEEWSAETLEEPIPAGSRVVVMEAEGLRLKVTRL